MSTLQVNQTADRDLPEGRKNPAYVWMIRELQIEPESYHDSAGEAQATALAEGYTDAHDHCEWLDDPDHWVWDAAVLAIDFVEATVRSCQREGV